jgi:hypothetical protein
MCVIARIEGAEDWDLSVMCYRALKVYPDHRLDL